MALMARATVRFTVVDPVAAASEVPGLRAAVGELAAAALRAAVGELGLEAALGARSSTGQSLLRPLVEVTAPWRIRIDGAAVERVDLIEHRGPAAVEDKENSWSD